MGLFGCTCAIHGDVRRNRQVVLAKCDTNSDIVLAQAADIQIMILEW